MCTVFVLYPLFCLVYMWKTFSCNMPSPASFTLAYSFLVCFEMKKTCWNWFFFLSHDHQVPPSLCIIVALVLQLCTTCALVVVKKNEKVKLCLHFLFLIFDLLFEMLIIRNNFTCKKMFWFCSSTPCLVFCCLYCCVAVSSSVGLLCEAVMKFLCFVTYLKLRIKMKNLFPHFKQHVMTSLMMQWQMKPNSLLVWVFFCDSFHWCEVQCLYVVSLLIMAKNEK